MKKIFYLMVAMILASCGASTEQGQAESEEMEILRVRSDIMANEAIRTGPLVTRKVVQSVEGSGRVVVPPNGLHTLHSPTEGYISDFKFHPGDAVSRGAVLLTVSHPGLIEKQRLFLETSIELDMAKKDLDRKTELRKSNATSEVTYEQADSRVMLLNARYLGLRRQMELWGIDVDRLQSENWFQNEIQIVSPISGVIDEIQVHPGQMVSPNDPVMSIADLRNLQLDMQVLARHASAIKEGQKVDFTIPGEDVGYTAKIYRISPQMNPGNETLKFHARPNKDALGQLIPGMFVQARIQLDSTAVTGLPAEAVVRQEGVYYAYGIDNEQVVKEALSSVKRLGDLVVFDSLPYEEFVIKGAYYLE